MNHKIRIFTALIRFVPVATVVTGMQGCAIVGSYTAESATPQSGTLYYLPKAVLPVQLVAKGGALEFRVLPATLVRDPAHRYLLKHPLNVLASDHVNFTFDESGPKLLKKIDLDSTDETLNVAKEAAKGAAIGRAESAAAVGEEILAEGSFDPDFSDTEGSNGRLLEDLNAALYRYVHRWEEQCGRKDIKEEKDKPAPENCALATKLLPRVKGGDRILRISSVPMGEGARSGNVVADCSVGVCYRDQQNFEIGLQVDGLYSRREFLMLPNKSPAVALPLDRAPFVKTEHAIEFQADGSLKSVSTKRPSSALQLVSWPLDVYKAVLSATSELITLRIGAKDNEIKLAQKELEAKKEFKKINDELEALKDKVKTSESAGYSAGTAAVLSIPLGRAKADQRSALLPTQQAGCKPGEPCVGVQIPAGGK